MGFPLMVRAIRLSLEAVDRKLEAAARTLGAGPLGVFFTITLPLTLPGILVGIVLAFARSLGEFGATIIFVGNIPGETRTIPIAIYTLTQQPDGDMPALRLSIIAVALALVALIASGDSGAPHRSRASEASGMLELSVAESSSAPFAFAAEFAALPSAGMVALFGRSGAGKTTLVNMLAGLLRPDSGRIARRRPRAVQFRRAASTCRRSAAGSAMSSRRAGSFPTSMCGQPALRPSPRFRRRSGAIKLPEIVDLLGIGHLLGRRPANLSGGEKQRVAIGRALLGNPRLLLMDEPLAALDAARKAEILPFIERLRDELGLPIVYVSHDPMEVLRLADRILLLEQGRVAAAGPVSEVFGRPELQRLIGAEEAGTVLSAVVAGHDETYGLSRLSFGEGGSLSVPDRGPRSAAACGCASAPATSRWREENSVGISILNNLPARIVAIHPAEGPYRDVEMLTAGVPLWARITARSVAELQLAIGQEVYAMVKAVSIDRQAFAPPPSRKASVQAEGD